MRKQTKLVAVLSAAALLAIGASMTSFAATGWQEENGTWVYYDKDGYQVSSEWKKSGNNWFYLNSDGEMATDTLVNDDDYTYYVDANGVMVTNQWVSVANEEDDDTYAPENYWYYFQSNGKAYKATGDTLSTSFKVINGKKYAFDEDGKMLYGWVNKNSTRQSADEDWKNQGNSDGFIYYCGDENDGAMKTGWQQIHVMDSDADDGEGDYWFYFKSNGQKTFLASDSNDAIKIATVNGQKYGFDENGKMVSGWTEVGTPPSPGSASNYAYFNDGGARVSNGWFKVVPSDKFDKGNNTDENDKWYYGDKDGQLLTSQVKKIKGKWYAFDEKGAMISGLQAMEVNSENKIVDGNKGIDSDNIDAVTKGELTGYGNYGIYYFGSGDDGAMRTGTQKVDVDGDSYSFNFDTKAENRGKGVNGLVKDVFYQNGRRLTASSDDKYAVVQWNPEDPKMAVPTIVKRSDVKKAADANGKIDNPNWYLIKTSGSIVKASNSSKDGYDYYYTVTKNGDKYNVTYYGADKEKAN